MALALPVFNMERLAWVRPILWAKSLERILRLASITSKFRIIITFCFSSQNHQNKAKLQITEAAAAQPCAAGSQPVGRLPYTKQMVLQVL
jgi:hypothetical protein